MSSSKINYSQEYFEQGKDLLRQRAQVEALKDAFKAAHKVKYGWVPSDYAVTTYLLMHALHTAPMRELWPAYLKENQNYLSQFKKKEHEKDQ